MENVICDLYCRVSTQEQEREGYSIGEQEERLRRFAEAQGWVINQIYVDGGYSGATMDRPGLKGVISDANSRTINKVCAYKLDRLSRSQKDVLYLIEDVFLKNGVDFVSMTESMDTHTPFGMATVGLFSVFAQLERETFKERSMLGMEARAKEGLFHGGPKSPFGYVYENGELHVHPVEAPMVQRMFSDFLAGVPMTRIAEWARSTKGIRGGSWHPSMIRQILKNPIYIGMLRFRGKEYQTKVEHLISDEDFHAVQTILKTKDLYSRKLVHHDVSTLAGGMVWCGVCGRRFTHKNYRSRANKRGDFIVYEYMICMSRCSSHKGVKNCGNRSWHVRELDELVLSQVETLCKNQDHVLEMMAPDPSESPKARALRAELEGIKKQSSRIMDLYAIGNIGIEAIKEKLQDLSDRREKVEAELAILSSDQDHIGQSKVLSLLDAFQELAEDPEENREAIKDLLGMLINSVTVYHDHIDIEWAFF